MLFQSRRQFLIASLGLIAFNRDLFAASDSFLHTVKRGDTLSEIARSYGVTISGIKALNKLPSDLIRIGQKLKIPQNVVTAGKFAQLTDGIHFNKAKWKYIVAHHSAIKHGNAKVYDKNHRKRGMSNGLAYHFVIGNGIDSGDGEIEIGPRWTKQLDGGHVRNKTANKHGIGICMVGNYQETRPTHKQLKSFADLVDFLGQNLLDNKYKFCVHKEVDKNHTVCPGRFFPTRIMHRRYN